MFHFPKIAIAGLTALSLTLTPISATAAPDGEDIAKTLAGLAVLGIIASAASDRKDKNRARSNQVYHDPYASIEGNRSRDVIDGDLRRWKDGRRKGKRFARHAPLPGHCALTLTTARHDRTVFGSRCLQRNYAFASKLPRDCRLKVRTDRGLRTVYGARCLRRNGWQVAEY